MIKADITSKITIHGNIQTHESEHGQKDGQQVARESADRHTANGLS